MEDKVIMNTVLTLVKNACDISMHGTIESMNDVKKVFLESLNKYLEIQEVIFTDMQNAGLYKIENVNTSKINKVANKYENTLIKEENIE